MRRREYSMELIFNMIQINKVIIDSHYERKHAGSITDDLVLNLVLQLDQRSVVPGEIKPPYCYFKLDKMELSGRLYRMIWLLEDNANYWANYIGVVNVHRR